MKITRVLFVLATLAIFALGVSGCNKGGKAAGDLEKLADKACACKDEACAKAVWKEATAFFQKHKETRGDEEAQARITKAGQKLMGCVIEQGVSQQEVVETMQKLQE